jgi:hypothetical protein
MTANEAEKSKEKESVSYTAQQIRGQINKFEESMHTIKARGHHWDYFSKDFKEIRFPSEPSPLTGGKMMDAFVHYDDQKEQLGVRIGLYLENESDVVYLLKKINKILSVFEANKIIQEKEKANKENP